MSFRVNKHHWTCGWDFGKTNHYHNFHVKIYYEKGWIISPFHYCIFTRGTNYQWSRLWFFFLFQPNLETDFPIHILIFNQKFQIRLQKDFEPNMVFLLRLKRSECFRNFCETVFVSDTFLRLRQTMEQFGRFFCSFICPFSEGLFHSAVEINWLNLFKQSPNS